jgi:hypothetical protein
LCLEVLKMLVMWSEYSALLWIGPNWRLLFGRYFFYLNFCPIELKNDYGQSERISGFVRYKFLIFRIWKIRLESITEHIFAK